jgi:hypothetical protein
VITHPPRAGAPATAAGATTAYVAAADVLSVRLASDPALRTSVVRWAPPPTAGTGGGPAPVPAIHFVLDQAGELLVGLVVEDASVWLPPDALDAVPGTPALCEVTASGRLWVSFLPEAPEMWRTATRVVLPGGSLAVQLLWVAPGRLVAVEVEDVARLHPSVLHPALEGADL